MRGVPVIAETSNSTRYGSPLPHDTSFSAAGRTMLYAPPEVKYHEGHAGYRQAFAPHGAAESGVPPGRYTRPVRFWSSVAAPAGRATKERAVSATRSALHAHEHEPRRNCDIHLHRHDHSE